MWDSLNRGDTLNGTGINTWRRGRHSDHTPSQEISGLNRAITSGEFSRTSLSETTRYWRQSPEIPREIGMIIVIMS